MSGTPPKGKKHTADASKGEQFVPRVATPVITIENEPAPPLPSRAIVLEIVRCADCRWGQDVSIGARRCRRNPPTPMYRNVHGAHGELAADPMWPRVRDVDYCGSGERK